MFYLPTIGLEIHAELKTRTKMFCGCLNDPDEKEPNVNVCPICLAHPGALPTINIDAVKSVLKLGLALKGKVAEHSRFDRKSYFYPDLPKGYQISQYEEPLVRGGLLNGAKIKRIHLEEDTGRLQHDATYGFSVVDFNRAGVPLLELVTEPGIKSGEEALLFAKELHLILRTLDISEADMEKGEMRIEANISVSQSEDVLGTKVEVKNLNSFRAVKDAIDFEIRRQEKELKNGRKIHQETRGWNECNGETYSQRRKEEAHDYRYFPEPDLPPMNLTDPAFINMEILKAETPELPEDKRARFGREFGLSGERAEIFVKDPLAARFFEESVSELATDGKMKDKDMKGTVYSYMTSDLFGLMKGKKVSWENLKVTPENFADLASLVLNGEFSSRMAKDVLGAMIETGNDPREIIKEQGISQIRDESEITLHAEAAVAENPQAVDDYKKGREASLQFLIGKTMMRMKGQGNPHAIKEVLTKLLK